MKPGPVRQRRVTRAKVVSWTVLGIVLCATALAFIDGDWISRTVAFASLLAGSVLVYLLAWRENRATERAHLAAQLHIALRHREQLHAERVRHQAVVQVLGTRLGAMTGRLALSERRASALQQQLSTMRGNYESLRVDLELQAALTSPGRVLELAQVTQTPDPWVTARELWRISEEPSIKRLA